MDGNQGYRLHLPERNRQPLRMPQYGDAYNPWLMEQKVARQKRRESEKAHRQDR